MKELTLKYFVPSDVLYIIYKKDKSDIGDIELQENVVLFRDEETNEVNSIEILNFKEFKENYIKISDKEVKDMTEPFRIVRMFISLEDIRGTNEYDETLKAWGFKKISRKKIENQELNLKFDIDKILTKNISDLESTPC